MLQRKQGFLLYSIDQILDEFDRQFIKTNNDFMNSMNAKLN